MNRYGINYAIAFCLNCETEIQYLHEDVEPKFCGEECESYWENNYK